MQSNAILPASGLSDPLHARNFNSLEQRRLSGDNNKNFALDVHHALYVSQEAEHGQLFSRINQLYERDAIYENPLMTIVSRKSITGIYYLANRWLEVNLYFPQIFSPVPHDHKSERLTPCPLLQIYRIWSEVVELSESDSFDGSRRVHLEHKVHLLCLPGFHSTFRCPSKNASFDSLDVSTVDAVTLAHSTSLHHSPSLSIFGINFPSPFHFSLRVLSRMSFNEGGRITHHRDIWDLRDFIEAVIPGARLTLWVTNRTVGYALLGLSGILSRALARDGDIEDRFHLSSFINENRPTTTEEVNEDFLHLERSP